MANIAAVALSPEGKNKLKIVLDKKPRVGYSLSMKNTTEQYRVRVTVARTYGPQYERTAWVAKNDGRGTWDGSWYTSRELEQVKTWKTRGGAQRWLDGRPTVVSHMAGVVEEVAQ